ncbi:MAG TPA: L,D-transpeptidase family protein [Stellaceae bacterium]|nr:L,D-transpeptidase family protein [Stellaceae bacterium]
MSVFSHFRWIGVRLIAGTMLFAASPPSAAPRTDLIGAPTVYLTQEEDTLLDVAHAYDLGYIEIRAANPAVDPWLPGAGNRLVLPTQFVMPDAPRRGIVINLPELRLYYFPAIGQPRTFPIGIGGEGKETPVGHTWVANKRTHPVWIPTKSERTEDPDLPAMVPAGPDNPMGDFALYLAWTGYAIHGTNRPYSIGRRDSHGCIRMYPEDIQQLFNLVPIGTPVTVVNQPVKLGRSGDDIYLEIHPDQEDAESLETTGAPRSPIGADADDLVVKFAGAQADRLDWYAIHLAEAQRSGVPVQITLPQHS